MHTNSQGFRNLVFENIHARVASSQKPGPSAVPPRPIAAPRESEIQRAPTAPIPAADAPPIAAATIESLDDTDEIEKRSPAWYDRDAMSERRTWARAYMIEHPQAKRREVVRVTREHFGIGIGKTTFAELRAEIDSEATPAPVPIAPVAEVVNDAVCALLAAIPDLHELRVVIDDKGGAAVSYSVREVRIVAGAIQVRR